MERNEGKPDYPGPPQTVAKLGFDACAPDVRVALSRFQRVIARSSRVDDHGEPGRSGRKCPTTNEGQGLEERWEVEAERPRDRETMERGRRLISSGKREIYGAITGQDWDMPGRGIGRNVICEAHGVATRFPAPV